MAKIYKRQLNFLFKWAYENQDKIWLYMSATDLPSNIYHYIYSMNPHENFDSNVERELADWMINNDITGNAF